jgi:hypothetical protein
MKRTPRILLAAVFLMSIAAVGVFVNLAADRFVELEKPTMTAMYTTDSGETQTFDLPGIAGMWEVWDEGKGEPVRQPVFSGNAGLQKVLENQILPGDMKVTITLTGTTALDELLILESTDNVFNLDDGRIGSGPYETVEGEWTAEGDARICTIKVEENKSYSISVFYGDSFVIFQFVTGSRSEEPNYTLTGYITSLRDTAKGTFDFDGIEWITLADTDRIAQLGLNPDDDMPGGFYLYNAFEETFPLEYNEDTVFYVLDYEGESGVGQRQVSASEFFEYWSDAVSDGRGPLLCRVEEELGIVKTVAEQYLP